MDLKQIQQIAARRFPFTKEYYPNIPQDEKRAQAFAQQHLHLHLNKNMGAIATALEPLGHGVGLLGEIEPATIRKIIVNAIRLADMSNISLAEVEASIQNWASGHE